MAAAFALVLERELRGPTRALWLLPFLQAIWVNFHPVFVLGPALCLLFLVGAAVPGEAGALGSWLRGGARAAGGGTLDAGPAAAAGRVGRLAVVTALCAAACLANPDFADGALYPVNFALYLGNQSSEFARHVTELLPPFEYEPFPTHAIYFFKLCLGALAVSAVLSWRRLRVVDLLLAGACLFAAVAVRRNVALCAILTAPLLARLAADAAARVGEWRPRLAGGAVRAALAAALLLAAGDVAFSVASGRWNASERGHRRVGFGLNPDRLPVRAVEWMQAEGIAGNTFASWDVGSYLLWQDFPRTRPWISTEGDHSLELLALYRAIVELRVDFESVARAAGIESAILRHTALDTKALTVALARSPHWVLVYGDDAAVVFVRRDGPYRKLVERRERAPFAPPAWSGSRPAAPAATADPWAGGCWDLWRGYLDASTHFRMAGLYGLVGRTDEEVTELGRALELFPPYVEAYTTRGAERAMNGQMEAAEADFRAALAAKPDHVAALRNLARLELGRQRLPQAIALLERACAANPRDCAAAFDLGTAQVGAGRNAEAIRTLEAILEVDPGNARVHRFLAEFYRQTMGDPHNAERHLRAISAGAGEGREPR